MPINIIDTVLRFKPYIDYNYRVYFVVKYRRVFEKALLLERICIVCRMNTRRGTSIVRAHTNF